MESELHRQNRQAMPTIAKFVDECRAVFGEVKVRFARENGIERGTPVCRAFDGPLESGIFSRESGTDWRLLYPDVPEGTGKTQESTKPPVLGSAARTGRTTKYK